MIEGSTRFRGQFPEHLGHRPTGVDHDRGVVDGEERQRSVGCRQEGCRACGARSCLGRIDAADDAIEDRGAVVDIGSRSSVEASRDVQRREHADRLQVGAVDDEQVRGAMLGHQLCYRVRASRLE